MRGHWLVLAAMAVACKEPSKPGDKGHTDPGDVDTGDTDDTGGPCTATVEEISPETGTTGVYYRDTLSVLFSEAASSAVFELRDSGGTKHEVSEEWDDTFMNAVLTPEEPLAGDTTYTLAASICESSMESTFATSAYGLPLEMEAAALVDNTYHFDLSEAEYTEPPGIGSLLAMYLGEPLLIGIVDADDAQITLMGAQGQIDDVTGDVTQDTSYTTWDFGAADFTESPYFSAYTDSIVIEYDGTEIPVHEFYLEGTFAADAETIGGGMARGLGDTRNLGELIGLGEEPDAVCEFIAGVGLECEECPDGETLCITIEAWFEPAKLIDGLVLEQVTG